MKKVAFILLLFLVGCSSIRIPNYIKDEYPYKETFYANFDEILKTAMGTVEDMNWKVEGRSNPGVYEGNPSERAQKPTKEMMLFTESKRTPFFLGTSYSKVNIYLTSKQENVTEVEIRYIKITSVLFKTFTSYRNDHFVKNIFAKMQETLPR